MNDGTKGKSPYRPKIALVRLAMIEDHLLLCLDSTPTYCRALHYSTLCIVMHVMISAKALLKPSMSWREIAREMIGAMTPSNHP